MSKSDSLAGCQLTLTTPGREYQALQFTGGGKRRYLAIHGWLDNAASFQPLSQHLDYAELVAVDMPGHGRSEHAPPGYWYHYGDLIWDAYNILDQLGWDTCTLLGHSMGATLCGLLAASVPERVAEVILLDAIGPMSTASGEVVQQLRKGLTTMAGYRPRKPYEIADLDEAADLRRQAATMSVESARLLAERGTRDQDGSLSWSSDRRLRMPSLIRLSEEHVLETLAAIESPAMLILAKQGMLKSGRIALNQRIAAVPGLQVVVLDGHHHLHMDDAEQCAQFINQFGR